jgi:hypothetical protein
MTLCVETIPELIVHELAEQDQHFAPGRGRDLSRRQQISLR